MPEVDVGLGDADAPELPLAAEGVVRYVWHGRFGDMLVEVRSGQVFVNGHAVERAATDRPSRPGAGIGD
jgi:hypothetical protein